MGKRLTPGELRSQLKIMAKGSDGKETGVAETKLEGSFVLERDDESEDLVRGICLRGEFRARVSLASTFDEVTREEEERARKLIQDLADVSSPFDELALLDDFSER